MNAIKKIDSQKIVYIGIGSNINPFENIRQAIKELKKNFSVIGVSRIWESAPVGSIGPIFLNGVVAISTPYSSGELKNKLREIERGLERVRTANKNAPRTIDLDILIFDREILDSDIWAQPYVAIPLAEVNSSLVNPRSGETIQQISDRLRIQNIIYPREIILE